MVRISSTFSSKLILATSITLVITIPIMVSMWYLGTPTPWSLLGGDEYFKDTVDDFGTYFGAYSSFSLQYGLNLIVIWPFSFAYSFWTIPSRLIIDEKGLRVKNFGKEKTYGFEQVKGLKFKQGESGDNYLKIKLHRQWLTFEIDYGQVRILNKYLPTYLNETSNDEINQ